ncbi:hypothetical protein E2C01_080675 [Portunus trituberculatus]|uniref:Uncharacterized protein n=1 Tax=Portunus trituberculatus TaxID=210409 RepID=A0A5B7IW09_PORTR|nr:hypothetical protein [Portunus trituberculatus]
MVAQRKWRAASWEMCEVTDHPARFSATAVKKKRNCEAGENVKGRKWRKWKNGKRKGGVSRGRLKGGVGGGARGRRQ